MSDDAVRSVLETNDHGVLSMAAGNRGYGVPMSYGFDEADGRLIVGFVNPPESKKRRFAGETEEVTLTVYDWEDVDSWVSVIATGTIRRLDGADVTGRVLPLFFRREDEETGDDRLVDLDESEREWYELDIDDLSGRSSE
ncbi:pyridoxamine 5'-phosphate oxidase family protein [Natrialbaceae archaeon GCM10025810]|uniref:pyridoxamine 5'-phosphate oxidase family protein n=1 Tax=Halovalidus salilacus TaxID=3075124 RepID=UPI00360BB053